MAELMAASRIAPANEAEAMEMSPNEVPDTPPDGVADSGVAAETSDPVARLQEGLLQEEGSPEMRDKLGRFVPHNQGGPGNPFGRHVARNRKLMLAAFSEEEVLAVIRKIHEAAVAGDLGSQKLFLQYLVGKPVEVANPDRTDHEEWELRLQQPSAEELDDQQHRRCPHAVALLLQRIADIAKYETMKQGWRQDMTPKDARDARQQEREERRRQRKKERQRRRR